MSETTKTNIIQIVLSLVDCLCIAFGGACIYYNYTVCGVIIILCFIGMIACHIWTLFDKKKEPVKKNRRRVYGAMSKPTV